MGRYRQLSLFGVNNMKEAIERIQNAQDERSFEVAVSFLQDYMKRIGMGKDELLELQKNAYYIHNEYSDKNTKENMETAKKRVISYIEGMLFEEIEDEKILEMLNNFYLFLECLIERTPDKRAGIQVEQFRSLKIQNEYDVQHFLYACIKLLYPMARTEVNEDTGYGTVRTDICLDSEHVIEVKCTRKNMSLKKLVEEIEADMIHYNAKNIYFFLYDKAKIIENPLLFKKIYEEKLREKNIHIVIHQSKSL